MIDKDSPNKGGFNEEPSQVLQRPGPPPSSHPDVATLAGTILKLRKHNQQLLNANRMMAERLSEMAKELEDRKNDEEDRRRD